MSIEQKLEELAKLAQQLDEAKEKDKEDDTEDEDDNESDIEGDDLDEVSLKTAVRAHTARSLKSMDADEYDTEGDMGQKDFDKSEKTYSHIQKKFGPKGTKLADKHLEKGIKNSEHAWRLNK